MQTLEIIRLSLIRYGIGLLPFAFAGLVIGGALHWSKGIHGRVRGWQAMSGVIWLGGTVMTVVKVVGLVKIGMNGRNTSKYPVSDQVVDVAVMAGIYAAVGLLEVVLDVWRVRRGHRDEDDSVESGSVLQPEEVWGGK
jgi:hypothetical protein